MRVSGLTATGDWRFGRGRAVYLRRSEAIRQNVRTRLRSFTDDWFLNVDAGLPWIEMLGTRGNTNRVLREIERVVLTTEGVRTIDRLDLVSVDEHRGANIEITITDIFNEQSTDALQVLP